MELIARVSILLFSIGIIFWFSNKRKQVLHPLLIMVCICTFFLGLIFTKIEISVGIGFGLFAIFSILRFRTENFSIYTIIFLFVSITLSIVNILYPWNQAKYLILINIFIVILYIICCILINNKDFHYKNSLEIAFNLTDFINLSPEDKHTHIAQTINKQNFYFYEKQIDTKNNSITLKVFFE